MLNNVFECIEDGEREREGVGKEGGFSAMKRKKEGNKIFGIIPFRHKTSLRIQTGMNVFIPAEWFL